MYWKLQTNKINDLCAKNKLNTDIKSLVSKWSIEYNSNTNEMFNEFFVSAGKSVKCYLPAKALHADPSKSSPLFFFQCEIVEFILLF